MLKTYAGEANQRQNSKRRQDVKRGCIFGNSVIQIHYLRASKNKNKKRRQDENLLELFELFNQQTPQQQQESLKTYDEMLLTLPPDNAEFFAKLTGYLVEPTQLNQT